MKPALRSIVWLTACSLTLGVLITIAISWAISAWMPFVPSHGYAYSRSLPGTPRGCRVHQYVGFGWMSREWFMYDWSVLDQGQPWRAVIERPPDMLNLDHKSWPLFREWGRASEFITTPFELGGTEHATGFPCVALWCGTPDERQGHPGLASFFGGIPLANVRVGMYRALPLTPVWTGFILDSFTWGGLSWLGVAMIARQRSRRRRRRGLCPRCAYDRLHDDTTPCPECGHTARSTTT